MRARTLGVAAVAVLLAFMVQSMALASLRDEAPADEYFGPFKVSILEIRNRLTRFEGEPNRELAMAGTVHGIDAVETAIEDWHRKYPHDSWLPGFLERIVHVYARARARGDAHAHTAFVMLERDYARTPQAHAAVRVAKRILL